MIAKERHLAVLYCISISKTHQRCLVVAAFHIIALRIHYIICNISGLGVVKHYGDGMPRVFIIAIMTLSLSIAI